MRVPPPLTQQANSNVKSNSDLSSRVSSPLQTIPLIRTLSPTSIPDTESHNVVIPDILPSLNRTTNNLEYSKSSTDSAQEFFLGPLSKLNQSRPATSPSHFLATSDQYFTPPSVGHSPNNISDDNVHILPRSSSPSPSAFLQLNFPSIDNSRACPRSRANSPPPAKNIVERRKSVGGAQQPSVRVGRTKVLPSVPATPILSTTQENGLPSDPQAFTNSLSSSLERQLASTSLHGSKSFGGNSRARRMTHDMAELFARAPWTIEHQITGNGGLKNAVTRAQAEGLVDKVVWVGSLGMPTDTLTTSTRQAIETTLRNQHQCAPVFVKDGTLEGHYNHYCKQILWPTLHYQIPDNPKSKAYEDHSWELYKAMNQGIADKIVKCYKEGDTIWINDYHLFLAPKMVREKLPNAKIGFFLHVSFPSSEVFRCLAARSQLLEGILGADCVGFQIPEYARHFLQTCNRILAVDTTPFGVRMERKFVSVVVDAIGVDPENLKVCLHDEEVVRWRKLIRERWPNSKLIVGRDKLDNIRGVKQKLQAYEQFLRTHPEMIDEVVLIQVCLMNKSEPELESDVTTIVDRINSLRSNLASSQPCVFLHQDIDFAQYIALLAEAKAFAVTSVREGMNLTCHEFIYCNDIYSPLILSEFTGAASVLGPDTILVNPWDRTEMAEAFYRAITMDEEEKKRRWTILYDLVTHNTCVTWVKDFLQDMNIAWAEQQRRQLASVPQLDMSKLREDYQQTKTNYRMFFLDLDCTSVSNEGDFTLSSYSARANIRRSSSTNSLFSLASTNSTTSLTTLLQAGNTPTAPRHPPPSTTHYTSSYPYSSQNLGDGRSASSANLIDQMRPQKHLPYLSPHRKLSMLYELVTDPKNIVYVMSGDSQVALERLFKHVPKVGLIAENGAFLRLYGSEKWIGLIDWENTREWQTTLKSMLADVIERLPGARLEVKGCTITVYVSGCYDQDRLHTVIGELVNHVNDAFASYEIHAVLQDGKVSIASDRQSKISAVKRAFLEDNEHLRAKLLAESSLPLGEGYSCIEMLFIAAEGGDIDNDRLFEWANSLPNGTCGIGMHVPLAENSSDSLYFGSALTSSATKGSDDGSSNSAVSSVAGDAGGSDTYSLCSDSDRVDMFSGNRTALKVPITYSVSVGGRGTYAQFMVDGMNGLLNALLNAMRQPSSYE